MSKESSLVVYSNAVELFPALATDAAAMLKVFRENLGPNDSLSAWDLDVIKMPTGGGLSYNIPVLGDENGEDVRSFDALLLGIYDRRNYWHNREVTDGAAPDCSSLDAMHGIGDPGGLCMECPMAEFGSAFKGKGQACKLVKELFLYRVGGGQMPAKLRVPPASLKNIRRYLISLSANGVPFYGATTRFSLAKTKNADGQEYSEIVVKLINRFDSDSVVAARRQVEGLRPIFEAQPVWSAGVDIDGAEISD